VSKKEIIPRAAVEGIVKEVKQDGKTVALTAGTLIAFTLVPVGGSFILFGGLGLIIMRAGFRGYAKAKREKERQKHQ